jgi:hypothetical protein
MFHLVGPVAADVIQTIMSELSPLAKKHLEALFAAADLAEAERLLAAEFDETERVQVAAIRLSGGQLDRLHEAIQLGKTDWRDLLAAAKFDSVSGHKRWTPRRFDGHVADTWHRGERIRDVSFAFGDAVQVSRGLYRENHGFPGPSGTVAALVALEPEPRYRVALSTGETVEVFQFAIRAAG